ncbi:unnamed protein product [Parnassius apollo]|uniref:(apollo) hypothetical protein n=1 Tax=Parnassius apollo TaxID=110799 RepID=A0A8S3XR09_PARAO|nr:unnamed protein product [Parnassius apollo]
MDYLRSILEMFRVARWLGIAGSSKYYWKLWGVAMIFVLTVVEIGAIWKVIKALAGWATSTSGHMWHINSMAFNSQWYDESLSTSCPCASSN